MADDNSIEVSHDRQMVSRCIATVGVACVLTNKCRT